MLEASIAISCNPASGSIFPIGATTVKCSAIDAAGNVGGPASFTVTVNALLPCPPVPTPPVNDTIPPNIIVPQEVSLVATGPDGTSVSFNVSALDNVDGPVDVRCDHNSGETFPIGETVVSCTAQDVAGSIASKEFPVMVQSPDGQPIPIIIILSAVVASRISNSSHNLHIDKEKKSNEQNRYRGRRGNSGLLKSNNNNNPNN